jgi:hypothetical protein
MSGNTNNPLSKHFRRPSIYFKLPSRGKFWADGSLDLPVTGDIPIFPMTGTDEITLKTPDALMNGTSVTGVIESCCPSIKDAWQMPSIDVDAILIAIRIASFGEGMDITATCPHCKQSNEYTFNLTGLLDSIKAPDYNQIVEFKNLKFKFRPQKYFDVTKANLATYEEQRMMQALEDPNLSEDVRAAKLKESVMRIIKLNQSLLVKATEYIETDDGTRVTDKEFITEFYENAEAMLTNKVETHLQNLTEEASIPPMKIVCGNEECAKEFTVPLVFDYSSFFAVGS